MMMMMMMMIDRGIPGLSQHVQTNPKLQLSCLEARVPSAVGNAATTGCWLNPTVFSENILSPLSENHRLNHGF